MAFYMLDVKIISREKGGCATRAAAYRAGERIRDERTRTPHDFTYREDVVHKEILLPSRFSASTDMDWARDRATLWNEVELTARRNGRLAREVLVVLPVELTASQRVQLARRFGQELAERYLAGVDATVHPPRPGSSELNHHAHLLMTPRQVTPEGLGPRTILELSGTELHALGLGPSKNELLLTRERWAQVTNEALRQAGLDVRVDHRSLKARGIDREPAPYIPHKILCMERKTGMPSKTGEAIRAAYRERVEARLKGPDELSRVLQRQKEAARLGAIERARQRAARPKGSRSATYTADERLAMRSERYHSDEALREKSRAYWRENAEVINQKRREARRRAQEQARGQEKQRGPRITPALTAEDSARNGLAYRERQKQAELTQNAGQRRAHERAFGKSVDNDDIFDRRRKKEHSRDYDYGL
jgi:hypothetical protein